MATDEDLTVATSGAIQEMIDFLVAEKHLDKTTAYQLVQRRRQRRDHPAGRRQSGCAREDAQGDFQMMFATAALAASLLAQVALPAPTPADFGQWERLSLPGDHGGLSPDGQWLAYAVARTSRADELRAVKVADGSTKVLPFGARPVFSADSKWMAAAVGVSEAQQENLRKEKKSVHNQLALLSLATGEITLVDNIESFAFSADGRQLLMRHYAPERGERREPDPAPALDPDDLPGSTATVRDLATGRDTTFGNVAEAAWQSRGRLLALVIAAEDRLGNGVQVFDPAGGTLRVLDSGPARYLDLGVAQGCRRSGRAAVACRPVAQRPQLPRARLERSRRRGGAHPPVRSAGRRHAGAIDSGRRVSASDVVGRWPDAVPGGGAMAGGETGGRSWAGFGHRRHGGIGRRRAGAGRRLAPARRRCDAQAEDRRAARRRAQPARGLDARSVVAGDARPRSVTEQIVPLRQPHLAYVVSWKEGALDRSWGRFVTSTLSLIDVRTGERTKLVDRVDDRYVSASPEGRFIMYYVDGQIFAVDVARKSIACLSKSAPSAFIDAESDSTDVQKPPFGEAGWTVHDAGVLLYDKYDVWLVEANGSSARRLTDGAAARVRYRYAKVDPDSEAIDLSKPIYFDLFGVWSKKSGFARLDSSTAAPQRLVWLDRSVGRLGKAKDAEVYSYVSQSAAASPDAFVGADPASARQVTHTNPFQSHFAWDAIRAGRVHQRSRRRAAGRAALSQRLPARPPLPDGGLRLREALRLVAPIQRAV